MAGFVNQREQDDIKAFMEEMRKERKKRDEEALEYKAFMEEMRKERNAFMEEILVVSEVVFRAPRAWSQHPPKDKWLKPLLHILRFCAKRFPLIMITCRDTTVGCVRGKFPVLGMRC